MADMNKMVTMGLPPKYKKPAGTPILNDKRSSFSSRLHIDESTAVGGTQGGAPWHRKSASDSLALVKKPYTMKSRSIGAHSSKVYSKPFDGGVTPVQEEDKIKKNENSSSPLDKNNSFGDVVPSGATYAVKTESDCFTHYKWWRNMDPNMDPRKIKRILANRQSAQKSRLRKLEYMADLEKKVTNLQAKVAVISPQVSYYDRQRMMLRMENSNMKQRIAILMGEKIFKKAQYQELKEEEERLKQLYELQQQQLQQEPKGMVRLEPMPEQFMNMNSTLPRPEQMLNMDSINLDSLNYFM